MGIHTYIYIHLSPSLSLYIYIYTHIVYVPKYIYTDIVECKVSVLGKQVVVVVAPSLEARQSNSAQIFFWSRKPEALYGTRNYTVYGAL